VDTLVPNGSVRDPADEGSQPQDVVDGVESPVPSFVVTDEASEAAATTPVDVDARPGGSFFDEVLTDAPAPELAQHLAPSPAVVSILRSISETSANAGRPSRWRLRGQGRHRLVVAAILAAVGVLVVAIVLVRRGHDDAPARAGDRGGLVGTPTSAPAAGVAAVRSLQAWVAANLSPAAVIVAPSPLVPGLRTGGFRHVVADDALSAMDWHTVDYLISVPGEDAESPQRAQLDAASEPLAVFATGSTAPRVGQVFAGGTSDLTDRKARDTTTRVRAGGQLVANPAIRLDTTTRAAVQAGRLDLRAASVLAVLSQSGTVWVRSLTADPAETRAEQPARVVTVTVADPAAVQSLLSGLIAPYRPANVTLISQGTLRLTWSPAVAAVLTAGG
jgi:hypothetical protein